MNQLSETMADNALGTRTPIDHEAADVDFYSRITTDFGNEDFKPGKGIDVGTTSIVACGERADGSLAFNIQRNAFIDVRSDSFTQRMLGKLGIEHNIVDKRGCVIGDPAFELSNIFEKDLCQPMTAGIITPGDPHAISVLRLIIERTLGPASTPGESCTISVPFDPIDSHHNVIYHRGSVQNILRDLGYQPSTLGQAQAVAFSELMNDDYTGICISCGGGSFNVCVSYKAIPAITFSIARGGEWIDINAARALGIPESQVVAVKESGLNLTAPKNRIEEAICIYYQNLIRYTIETIRSKFAKLDDIPTFTRPVPMICAGGTALIDGFLEMMAQEVEDVEFPVDLSEIRLAADPTHTVATGCLRAGQLV